MTKKRMLGEMRTEYTAVETKKNVIELCALEDVFTTPKRKWYQVFLMRRDKIFAEGYHLGYKKLQSKLRGTYKVLYTTGSENSGIGISVLDKEEDEIKEKKMQGVPKKVSTKK